mmetsp:Transcript_28130/g.45735  ORF Transcript_28130/g.45735 Transcript_28130/m.45735 type:complete len:268 (+) Transcript_28130:234-1037(+)
MLNTMRLASLMGKSNSGLEMAATAASVARVLPAPVPTPINAVPASFMTARTSAKSTLTNPVLMMISEIPTTPCRSMSSATRNASVTGVFSGTILSSLSLETTIRVSTCLRSSTMAASACCIRFFPSNANGFVTTPTVRHPSSLAISATTGPAPLPVPPPMPAVMKIMSAPEQICWISFAFSCALSAPTEGTPPAPRPRVTCRPMLRTLGARERARAWASVLTAQKETPSMRVWIMRLTALPPPPPMPSTLITQGFAPPSGMITPPSV